MPLRAGPHGHILRIQPVRAGKGTGPDGRQGLPSQAEARAAPLSLAGRMYAAQSFRWAMAFCSSGRFFSTVHRKTSRAQTA